MTTPGLAEAVLPPTAVDEAGFLTGPTVLEVVVKAFLGEDGDGFEAAAFDLVAAVRATVEAVNLLLIGARVDDVVDFDEAGEAGPVVVRDDDGPVVLATVGARVAGLGAGLAAALVPFLRVDEPGLDVVVAAAEVGRGLAGEAALVTVDLTLATFLSSAVPGRLTAGLDVGLGAAEGVGRAAAVLAGAVVVLAEGAARGAVVGLVVVGLGAADGAVGLVRGAVVVFAAADDGLDPVVDADGTAGFFVSGARVVVVVGLVGAFDAVGAERVAAVLGAETGRVVAGAFVGPGLAGALDVAVGRLLAAVVGAAGFLAFAAPATAAVVATAATAATATVASATFGSSTLGSSTGAVGGSVT